MANAFVGLFIRLDTAEVSILTLSISQQKPSKEKKTKEIEKDQRIGEEWDITNGVTFKWKESYEKRERKKDRNI